VLPQGHGRNGVKYWSWANPLTGLRNIANFCTALSRVQIYNEVSRSNDRTQSTRKTAMVFILTRKEPFEVSESLQFY
jgi:hypothetical protein